MGTILASYIIDELEIKLNDTANKHWSRAELLKGINFGQREIVTFKPDANALITPVQLSPGTKQAIPAGGIQFIGMPRNMGADGQTPGRAVTVMDKDKLDKLHPDWHTDTPSGMVRHVMFDDKVPKVFWVTPPQPDPAHHAEIAYSVPPADIADETAPINLDDIYANPLYYYGLYWAYTDDAEDPANLELAAAAYNQFLQLLGVKDVKEEKDSPNRRKWRNDQG